MTREDEEWKPNFDQMTPVPFPDHLRERILQQAREQSQKSEISRGKRQAWKAFAVATAGISVAGLVIAGVFSGQMNIWPHDSSLQSSSASRQDTGVLPAPLGLQGAKLMVGVPVIGSGSNYPKNTYVYAELKNVGRQPIDNSNTFGILYFTPKGSQAKTWQQSNSATFVQVLGSEPQLPILPGQSIRWGFHPVGAPQASQQGLTETPHLQFFQSGLVASGQASVHWQPAGVQTKVLAVQPRLWTNGQFQTIDVRFSVTNTTRQALRLGDLWFVIWFSPAPGEDFTQPHVERFLDFAGPSQQSQVLQPGEQATLSLKEDAAASTKIGTLYPHVSAILRE